MTELEQLKAENVRLNETGEVLHARNRELESALKETIARNAQLTDESSQIAARLDAATIQNHEKECREHMGTIGTLQAENARLAAEVLRLAESLEQEIGGPLTPPVNAGCALRDLLAPTIELLETCETLARAAKATDLALECAEELARLEAIVKGDKK